jgi:crotonobetainyl-CoA:carnitine CoA-transferase CaiB-like acyl-CoA transferase
MWAMGQAIAMSLVSNIAWQGPPSDAPRLNPLVHNFKTKDDRSLSFCCLQATRYWAELCAAVGRPELGSDPRFADHAALLEHSTEAQDALEAAFAEHTLAEWRTRLADFTGQWCVVQDTLESVSDPQSVANGYVQDCETAEGVSFQLVAAPVQFGGEPSPVRRAPAFNEHGDAILEELGIDWDTIVDLKVRSVVG